MSEGEHDSMLEAIERLRRDLRESNKDMAEIQRDYSTSLARIEEIMKHMVASIQELTLGMRGDGNGRLGVIRRQDRTEGLVTELFKRMEGLEGEFKKLRENRGFPLQTTTTTGSRYQKTLNTLIQNWPGILTGAAALLAVLLKK